MEWVYSIDIWPQVGATRKKPFCNVLEMNQTTCESYFEKAIIDTEWVFQ